MHNLLKRTKQNICIILAVILMFSLLPISASAVELEENIKAGDHLQWGTYNDKAITWIAISDSSSSNNSYVDVMSKYAITSRCYHNKNNVPGSFGDTSLYSWLNSKSGFWSEENFSKHDRNIRASDEFSVLSFFEVIDIFSNPKLQQYAVAKRNGKEVDWWIAGYDDTMASQNMAYVMRSTGEIGTELLTDVPNTKKGVRPITSLNLDSFYISSGTGKSSDPYIIHSVYDSDIKSLSVSGCALSPSFKASTNNYTSTVTDNVESITINPKASDNKALLTVYSNANKIEASNDSYTIPLEYGENEIKIRVLAVDNFTETVYTIKVTREEPKNTLFVTSLKFFEENPRDELLVSPTFLQNVYNYTIDVGKAIDTGRIEYVGAPNSTVTMSLNGGVETSLGAPNEQGILSNTFNVTNDLTLITLTVTSENQREVRKYVVNVKHSEAAAYVNPREESSQPPEGDMSGTLDPGQTENEVGMSGAFVLLIVFVVIVILAAIVGVIVVIVLAAKRKRNMPTNDQIDEILRNNHYPDNNIHNGNGNGYMPTNSQYYGTNQAKQPQNRPVQPTQPNGRPTSTQTNRNTQPQRTAPANRTAQPTRTAPPVAKAPVKPNGNANNVNMEQTRVIGGMNGSSVAPNDIEHTRIMPSPTNAEQNMMGGANGHTIAFGGMDTNAGENVFNSMNFEAIDNSQPTMTAQQTQVQFAQPTMPTQQAQAQFAQPTMTAQQTQAQFAQPTQQTNAQPANTQPVEAPAEMPQEKPRFVLNFDADKEINMDALNHPQNDNYASSGNEDMYSGKNNDPVKILEDKIDFDPSIDIFSSSKPIDNDSENESIVDENGNAYSANEPDYRLDINSDDNF